MWLRALVPLTAIVVAAPALKPEPAPDGAAQRYRDLGPEGLRRYLAEHGDGPELDQVCAQYDCARTHLYWFTDLEAAKAEARRTGRPILALHLLGRFDERLTCANSRFFRRMLYPDPRVNALMQERFVLYWRTVRPVPKVTIDFGDGRTMERTLTGNSMHVVLDAQGRPLDVLPGLFAPEPFARALGDAAELSRALSGLEGNARTAALETWHENRLLRITGAWSRDLRAAGVDQADNAAARPQVTLQLLQLATDDARWERLSAMHAGEHRFSERVREGLSDGFPKAEQAAPIAITKAVVENPLLSAVRRVEATVGRDSLRNQWSLHGQVHAWFMSGALRAVDVPELERRVYARLFQSPLDDPWYGLSVPEELQLLDDGVVVTAR